MSAGTQRAEQAAELAGLRAYLASLPETEAKRSIEAEAVMKLISRGWSYNAVSSALGLPKTTCHRRAQKAMADRVNPYVDKHREIAGIRLDEMTKVVAAVIDSSSASHADKVAAVRAWVAIEQRRAAVFGTDAPTNTHLRLTVEEDEDAQLERLIAATKAQMIREQASEPREITP